MPRDAITQSKMNTWLIGICGFIAVACCTGAWACFTKVQSHSETLGVIEYKLDNIASKQKEVKDELNASQKSLWEKLMPRSEVESQMAQIKKDIEHLSADNNDFRLQLLKLQIDFEKNKQTVK